MQIAKPLWWSAGIGTVAGYALLWPQAYRIPCLINLCTGLQCPGCGTTRALTALFQGDLVAAFNYNQLIWFIPVFLLSYQITKKSRWAKQIQLALTLVATFAAIGYFFVRNA